MFQVRIHGRGGQGVVTAAELLAVAVFDEGKHAQAFPSFGSERTGAPVVAYCRISEHEIRAREPIMEPDALIIQDASLIKQIDVFAGLKAGGFVIVNSTENADDLLIAEKLKVQATLAILPATELAMTHLGRPVPNAVLLGAFSALTGVVSLEAVTDAINEKFKPKVAAGNVAAATAAYEYVMNQVATNA
ncbi:MAG: 2-oxoacid:acceptor oxidoreductase family protein [Actinomycetes bacterium]